MNQELAPSTNGSAAALAVADRYDFSTIRTAIPIPNLIEMQRDSYRRFLQMDLLPGERDDVGLEAVFKSVFPISDFREMSTLDFVSYSIGDWECKCGSLAGLHHLRTRCDHCHKTIRSDPKGPPRLLCGECGSLTENSVTFCQKCGDPVGLKLKYDEEECQQRSMTYSAPLKVTIKLTVFEKDQGAEQKAVRDIKEQEVFFGEIPLMTDRGTFIVSGTERVIVSQLHRSPGVFFEPGPNGYFLGKIIPYRGSWVEFEYDQKNLLNVRIDRKRKFLGTIFLRALGLTDDAQILGNFYRVDAIRLGGEAPADEASAPPVSAESGTTEAASEPVSEEERAEGAPVLLRRVSENLLGTRLARNIRVGGRLIGRKERKVNPRLLQQLKEADVEWIECPPETLQEGVFANDIFDTDSGEIFKGCEANAPVTEEALERIRDAGIREFGVIFPESDECGNVLSETLRKDSIKTQDEALLEIYRKLRPGDPPTRETAWELFHGMFFDARKYDFSRVGRMKFNIKIHGELDVTPLEQRVLDASDFFHTIGYLFKLRRKIGATDDIDHLGNRRVRAVGELLENQFRIGLIRMERAMKERMTVFQDMTSAMPHDLINAKPVMAAVREFFGSSQLSQFMDQINPLSEITHKRRLSALGPGGLSRERAGFDVRDVHTTHYGRICPIETPEGPNIGLISSLSCFARINEYGFIESPYRRVENGLVVDEVRIAYAGSTQFRPGDIVRRADAEEANTREPEEYTHRVHTAYEILKPRAEINESRSARQIEQDRLRDERRVEEDRLRDERRAEQDRLKDERRAREDHWRDEHRAEQDKFLSEGDRAPQNPNFDSRDPYEILGVDRKADSKTIIETHKSLIKIYHPDRNPDGLRVAKKLNEARSDLLDKDKRKVLDAKADKSSSSSAKNDLTTSERRAEEDRQTDQRRAEEDRLERERRAEEDRPRDQRRAEEDRLERERRAEEDRLVRDRWAEEDRQKAQFRAGLVGDKDWHTYLGVTRDVNPEALRHARDKKLMKGPSLALWEPFCSYLSAWEEDRYVIAQANIPVDGDGSIVPEFANCRVAGDFHLKRKAEIQYLDVSPKQLVSVAASLIPFLENDDANRALMGSNMQRQAVPLLRAESPIVGTGMERITARDSGAVVLCKRAGVVDSVDSERIIVRVEDAGHEEQLSREVGADIYQLIKFRRSNQNTCINQKPVVQVGERVAAGQVLADGPCTDNGELALGRNVLVAFMPWRGYNFEDAILVSEKLVREDYYTSLHVEEFEIEARETKLGPEEITRDIPNITESFLQNLDESGVIRIGATVNPDDILVGKVVPKGDVQLTPEEKLLRAIFGDKAGEVKDASLRCPPGVAGVVVGARVFSRKGIDKDVRALAIEQEEIERLQRNLDDEKRILFDQRSVRLETLFSSCDVLADLHDDKTNRRLAVAGEPLTREHFDSMRARDLKRLKLALGSDSASGEPLDTESLHAEIDLLEEMTIRQIQILEKLTEEKIAKLQKGDELPPGVIKAVKIFIAMKRKLSAGDKMAGRHGNKGVIARVLPEEDMPFLPDGTPVEIVLNPLGVPSRMNVGQILETHLGWAGYMLGTKFASPVFEGPGERLIKENLENAGLPPSGKTELFDGVTGQAFEQEVTVGVIYMLKLSHLVDDKIHARSIGPYSLITQQPLGGKAQFGGQRFGEMEVWALEAYGAAHILQELLTAKSDDVYGRAKIYESIVKGESAMKPGVPESFNVLIRELQSLCLDVELVQPQQDMIETALAAD